MGEVSGLLCLLLVLVAAVFGHPAYNWPEDDDE